MNFLIDSTTGMFFRGQPLIDVKCSLVSVLFSFVDTWVFMNVVRVLLIKIQHNLALLRYGVKIQKVCTRGYFMKNVTKGQGLGVSLNHICTLSVSPMATFLGKIKENRTKRSS